VHWQPGKDFVCFIVDSWTETALVSSSTYFETKLLVPSSITYYTNVGDKNQLQVLPAGQQKFE
jgi:hypothetical protein